MPPSPATFTARRSLRLIAPGPCRLQRRVLAIALALAGPCARANPQASVEFSDGFLIGGKAIDMRRYTHDALLESGVYRLDVMLNGQWKETAEVQVEAGQACVTSGLVRRLGLKAAYLVLLDHDPDACVALVDQVEGSSVVIDSETLQLRIGIPQAMQETRARGEIMPEQRDYGVTAGFIDYNFNQHRSQGHDNRSVGVRAGLNLGAWRLRSRAWVNPHQGRFGYANLGSELQRDLPGWNSQVFIGQGNTGGELFESASFTGVRLASDERMLPDSLRGYAPVVRGIAESNAVVRVRQGGHVIHEASVAPGPFAIDDLYPTSFGGDLEVSVTEADGREQRFTVAFSAVPQALRAGSMRFSASGGVLRDMGGSLEPLRFAEGTYARGLNNRLTLLGGIQAGGGYQSMLAGTALNTAVGAFGADLTQSHTRRQHGSVLTGNSIRLNFQRYVASTRTHLGLAALRYNTRGFLTLNDAARLRSNRNYSSHPRQRYQLNFTQQVGARSSMYLSGGRVGYWDSTPRRNDFQLGVQSTLGRANVSLSAMRYRLIDRRQDTRYTFTFGIPLGRSAGAPRATAQLGHAARGNALQAGLAGALDEARALTYTVTASQSTGDSGSYDTYVAYQGGSAALNAGYSHSTRHRSVTLGAAGSVVLHPGGLNFAPAVGEGFVLVQAEGAEGAMVGQGDQIRVAANGYALLPHVSPYRWNQIELDPSGLPLDVELLQTSQRVAPTAGSIVRVAFTARRERTLFIDVTDALGQPLPFAARVESDDGRAVGAVGQGGVIQLRGGQDAGVLVVDPTGPHRCRMAYVMPAVADRHGLRWHQAECLPLAPAALPRDEPDLPLP
jgi:outer membrane usher protein